MEDLRRRNTVAVQTTLEGMEKRIQEQAARIDGLHDTMSTMFRRLDALETSVGLIRAITAGNGPTVR